MSADLPKTFCPLPWINLSLDTDGSVRPCCKFIPRFVEDREYEFPFLRDGKSLEDVWNSNAFKQLRQDFLDGKMPKSCKTCWDEEAAGVESFRQNFMRYRLIEDRDYSSVVSDPPKALDLKLTNTCNLKCRICGPVASSTYLIEMKNANQLGQEHIDNQKFYLSKKLTDTPAKLSEFKNWINHLTHVEIFGGEPFLCPESIEIEDLLVESGRASEISMLYNSNATIFEDTRIDKWRMFRRIQLNLSVDDFGDRLNYQRYPSDWKLIKKNMGYYHDMDLDNLDIMVFPSISLYNIWQLDEFLELIFTKFPKFDMTLNLVHYHPYYQICNLPSELKKVVVDKLENLKKKFPDKRVVQNFPSIIEFMMKDGSDDELSKFKKDIDFYDSIRSQKFSDIYPEYSQLLGFS